MHRFSLAVLFHCFLITFTVGTNDPTFTGDFSINCGSTGPSAARSGRKWSGDVQPTSSSLLQLKGSSTASTATGKPASADPVPHKTARISRSRFSYSFQVSPGQKIIRLHFSPTPYRGFKGLKDLFTVEAGPFTLLSNFSASITAHALGVDTFVKEFSLNIQDNQQFIVVFSPETSRSLDTYAFINGIEIIPVPASLSYFHGGGIGLQVVGQKSLVFVDSSIALERIYRLNIKHHEYISSADDKFGMGVRDHEQEVCNTNNITWRVSVDVGFRYLIRLHFSKPGLKMAEIGGLDFKVLINEMVADTNSNIVVKGRDGNGIPWYGDYIVMMNGRKVEGKRDLLIHLQSNEELTDGPLKGFELLKLSNHDNSLASPNPLPPSKEPTYQMIQILLSIHGRRNAIEIVVMAIISIACIIVHKLREISEASSSEEEHEPSIKAKRLCRPFSLAEIQLATRDFSDGLVIGRGGFGKVYKGLIDKGKQYVAIKRLKSNSTQGAPEFLMEIETLSELRHINLVSLIGYCRENREMILVYEYMPKGTLADHLYKLERDNANRSRLTWKQRLSICIGAARGLDYLHTGHGVIHRDIKASNILLDEDFIAKVSDFGLAKLEDRSKLESHVSTKVKGTPGYLDPYYYSTRKLTRRSDTYAFGVVLLEVLCERPAVDFAVSEDERILTMWARDKIRKGEFDQIVASSLREEISPNSLKAFLGVTESCLHDEPKNRPTMAQVVLQLEYALEQKDNHQNLVLNEIASIRDEIQPPTTNVGVVQSSTVVQAVGTTHLQQNLTVPSNEQTKNANAELISGHRRRSTMNRQSRVWPWNAIWNMIKPPSIAEQKLREADIKLPRFDWDEIRAATNHFSTSKIVGRGGFGSVYKAVLTSGEVVTVKRCSRFSNHGLKQFLNEIIMLSNLRHRNIIKLLGYCIHGEELLLVYEFMENTSLDTFIEDGPYLEWAVRFKIIMGIARGLVYLHELRVVHRDPKPSNILLDAEMNPKISNFALTRSLEEYQSELQTSNVAGTYYYISPEYYMYMKFSYKSDVYNFGIGLLEIVSRRRAFSFRMVSENLIEHVWKLWNEGRVLDLVDGSLESAFREDEAQRCIQVALLCIQENPNDRPSMAYVIRMLEGVEQLMQPQPPPRFRDSEPINENTNIDFSIATFEFDDPMER